MTRYYAATLIGCFLASICYEWVFPGWDGYYLSKLLIITSLSFIFWMKLSYSELLLKSLAFIVLLDSVWNVGQFFMNGAWQGPLELLNAIVFLPWLAYAFFRRYSQEDDVLTDRYVYTIAKRPDSPWGFVGSLFGDPYGNYSHYIRGTVYYFHKGEFLSMPMEKYNMAGKTIIKSDVEVTAKVVGKAHGMLSSKWSLWKFNNCMTVLARLRHVHS